MQPDTNFGHKEIVTELIRGVVDTVASKPGQSPERHAAVVQSVVCSVMAFNPRDPVETMMAGQCIIYDHLLRDGARDMLRGKAELEMIKARPGVLACGKMFLATVSMLVRMQRRPELGLAFARPIEEPSEQTSAETEAPPLAAGGTAAEPPAQPGEPPSIPRPAEIQTREAAVTPARPAGICPPKQRLRPANPPSQPAAVMSAPGAAVPEQHQQMIAPLPHPLMAPDVEAILFDGIDEITKQEIMAVAAQAVREFEAAEADR